MEKCSCGGKLALGTVGYNSANIRKMIRCDECGRTYNISQEDAGDRICQECTNSRMNPYWHKYLEK